MKYVAAILFTLLWLVGMCSSGLAAVDCPETPTVPPTAWEPTPSSPPEWTATPYEPEAEPTPTPDLSTGTPGITSDPTPTETPGITETPGAGRRPAPTVTPNMVMPETGFFDENPLLPTVLGGLLCGGLAIVLWMRRHAAG